MDRELLEALNNVGIALEQIADSLDKNNQTTSPSAKALQSGDFSDSLIKISEGIEMLKDDNKKILDNQETIIKLQKQQSSPGGGMIEGAGKQKEMLKDGISVILLVAGAVMAIGLAFQLVGNVDWVSVIALSLSLPLIAYAFEKMAVMKDLTASNMVSLLGVSVTMATAIAMSSWILQTVVPIAPFQLITAILIAGVFAVISLSMGEMMSGAAEYDKANVSPGTILAMFGAISAGIVISSWVMNLIVPISFAQGFTAILIAGTFAIIAQSMGKLMKGVSAYKKAGIGGETVILSLMAISSAITASSWIMNLIVPVSFAQGLTAIMISVTFAVIAQNMPKLMKGVSAFSDSKVSPANLLLSLVSISTAITVSSWIMNLIVPISMTQALTSIVIAGIFAGISYFMKPLAKGMAIIDKTIGMSKLFMLPLFFTAVSAAIAASSWILSTVVPMDFGQMLTVVGIGLALSIITPLLGMSLVLVSKLGKISDYLMGGLAVLVIASTIAMSSLILGLGDYGNYPDLDWSIGVGLSILAFGVSTLALGLFMVASGGIGAGVLAAGAASVVALAFTIVATSHILSLGNYDSSAYPSMGWIGGVGLTLTTFGLLTIGMALLGGVIMFGSMTTIVLAGTIYSVSKLLSRGEYEKYPSDEWINGVGKTLLKFGGVMAAFGVGTILLGPLMSVGSMAFVAMAGTIYSVSKLLGKGEYGDFPSTEWISGVSSSMSDFIKIYKDTDVISVLSSEFADALGVGLPDIAESIVKMDKIFSKGKFMIYPDAYYMASIKKSIFGYSSIVDKLNRDGIPKLSDSTDDIVSQSDTLIVMADSLDTLGDSMYRFSNSIDSLDIEKMQAIRSLSTSVVMLSLMDPVQFDAMLSKLESKSEVFSQLAVDMEEKRKEAGLGVAVSSPVVKKDRMIDIGNKLDNVTALLADISSVVGSSGTLKNYLMSIRDKQIDDNIR